MTPAKVKNAHTSPPVPAQLPKPTLKAIWNRWQFLAPVLLSLVVYWRIPFTWFRIDDFAWLGLPRDIHGLGDLFRALFEPQAQGTVRVLSERLFFLVLGGIFGLHAWPFRLVAFATWAVNLILIQKIGARLTGSRAAGLLAGLFWSVSPALVVPLAWASAYNQLLCMLCVLGAFYCRLRWLDTGASKWRYWEAAAYLAGFGALEVIVVYPAIVLFHALADRVARPFWRSALWMYLPAGFFALAHFFLIPKDPSDIYRVIVDRRMPGNFLRYLGWAIGPSDRDALVPAWHGLGLSVTIAIGTMLAAFVIYKMFAGEKRVVFMAAWFVLFLAPVLPLPNHISVYYLAIPGIGFAWLAGWAMVQGYHVRHPAGVALMLLANGLALAYGLGAIAEVQTLTAWHLQVTSRIRTVIRAAEAVAATHPGDVLVLQGVDDELFRAGFRDDPFRLTGVEKTVLAPDNVDELLELPEFKQAVQYRTTREQLLPLLDAGKARVLNVASDTALDITVPYRKILHSEFLAQHRDTMDLGSPFYTDRIGKGWFPVEDRARWMGKSANVTMSGPRKTTEHLYVTGFAAPGSLANGKVILSAKINGTEIGWAEIVDAGHPYTFEFDIPAKYLNAYGMDVVLECDKTFRPPGDTRDLGTVIQKIEVREMQ